MSATAPTVLVTRPPRQAAPLCQALSEAGMHPIALAVLDIQPCAVENSQAIDSANWLIFTSPNAVWHAQAFIASDGAYQIAAVGQATAKALGDLGFNKVLIPERDYSSEGLLALDAFAQIKGQKIALIKGRGGRKVLATQLRHAGAEVTEVCVYERIKLNPATAEITQAIKQAQYAVVTSQEILERLHDVTPHTLHAELLTLRLVVPSDRVVQMAHSLGFTHVRKIASPLTEAAMVSAVLEAQVTKISSGQNNA